MRASILVFLRRLQAWADRSQRQVLLIDTFEKFAPLDSWLRELFLPQLPEDILIVVAGHLPPSPAWAADPGKIVVQVDKPGAKLASNFYGLMTEEINFSYEGGLYAELFTLQAEGYR